MRRKRLLWQLYPSYLLPIVLSLVVVTGYASSATRRFFHNQTANVLEARARVLERYVVGRRLPADPEEMDGLCKDVGKLTDSRITVILPSGTVVADSDSDPKTMENHADRPEIVEALAGRVGRSVRPSPTLRFPMMYVAVLAQDRHGHRVVVRTAMSLGQVDRTVRDLQVRIGLVGLGIAVLAAVVCLVVSRWIARPLEEMKRGVERLAAGDLACRLNVPSSEETASLAVAINEMAAQLQDRIRMVTAQRNEQEAVFSSMVEGVLAVDVRERILRINQSAGRLLDIHSAEAHGKTILEVVRNAELQEFVARTLSSAVPTEGEILFREGGERWMQAHGTILNDASGGQIGAVVVLNDITRIRRLESFRRDFVANVSHELRTPITSIKGFVETLLDGAVREPESTERFLGIIARQADRLNAIINDLLLLSKLEQQGDKAAITTEEAAICGVLDTAVEFCVPKATAKKMNIDVRCEEGLRARVNVALLEQAVVNLVDNAVKYSEPGKSVSIEAARRERTLTIQVRDEGWGIEKEHLSRVFERFYRVDKGRSRELGGTGLGLAIVKHIAQAHGGSVAVESTPGKGSVFTIILPLR